MYPGPKPWFTVMQGNIQLLEVPQGVGEVVVGGMVAGVEAIAAVVLTLVMVPCVGVPVAVGVGWRSYGRGAVGCTWLVPFGSASVRLPLRTCGHQCAGG